MLRVNINGSPHDFPEGITILDAARALVIEVPTLCHDDRLQPCGACRLCSVEIDGWDHLAAACATPLQDGMVIRTHSPVVEATRRTLLRLLARNHPAEAVRLFPEKPFHRYVEEYGAATKEMADSPPNAGGARDDSHPYISVDRAKCIACFRCVRICDEVQGQFVWKTWHRGSATEIGVAARATLRDSACVSCGACVDTCPTGALEDKTVLAAGMPTNWACTVCAYCGVGCEIAVGTHEGKIVQVRPAPAAVVNKGHLCAKGRYAFGYVSAPDRITEPMIRRGKRWEAVAWPEAVGAVADHLNRAIAKHGPDSIGVLGSARATNEENYLTQKFARIVIGTNNVDCCARVCHAPTASAMKTMLGAGAATNSFDDIEHARCFLVCGANPTENHPVVGARIKQAVRRGAKLIVIDPRRIELAEEADVHLALKPGTNVLLLNAIACALVEERFEAEATLRERLGGWDEFKAFIRRYAPERVAGLCGVEATQIRDAALLYGMGRPSMCLHGLGVTEHWQGTAGVMCLVNLALLTGNLGRRGGGVNPLRGQNNVQGAAHMGCDPATLTGGVTLEAGCPDFAHAWGRPLPERPGLNLPQMIDAAQAGHLKALWAIGYDVALTDPNSTVTQAALRSLEFVVVQDMFLNETAREHGSVFLPAASAFEKDGTFMSSERRVQRVRCILAPPGQAKADWEIICDLARAMGHAGEFAFNSPEEIWNEIRSVWPAGRGITYARLDRAGLQWPCPHEDHPGTPILHSEGTDGTPRFALQCVAFSRTREATSPEYPFLLTTGRTLFQFNAGTMTMRTPNAELRPFDTLDLAADDAARLGLREGEVARVRSRYGETTLPVHIDPRVNRGTSFATFHTADASLNRLTSFVRDSVTDTPEYKIVAVRIERQNATGPAPQSPL